MDMMEKEKLLQQCRAYFKSNPGFNRIFLKIRDKYQSLGKIGGTIQLQNLTQSEKEALTGFLKKNYYKNSVTIKVEKFEKALLDTPFEGLNLVEILHCYFNEEIVTRKDQKNSYHQERERYFAGIMDKIRHTKAHDWICYVFQSRGNAYRSLLQRYDSDQETLQKDIIAVSKGINHLPCYQNKKERLALFASRITKNPHAFDENTECGKLLIHGMVYILGEKYPQNAEERAELLYKAGIVRDEISNFTMCSGLLAYKNDEIHKGWEGFYHAGEPLQISLWNLSVLQRVTSPNRRIFVFENPTVFSEVLYRTGDKGVALLCTYGQVKLASLVLLDMLAKEHTHIYYSGDFDPEGLVIADKLKDRYKKGLTLWRYSQKDYEKAVSHEIIDHRRMGKIHKLKDEVLIHLGNAMIKQGRAGYQELLVDELVSDINRIIGKERNMF